jgi:hypothetical protein
LVVTDSKHKPWWDYPFYASHFPNSPKPSVNLHKGKRGHPVMTSVSGSGTLGVN